MLRQKSYKFDNKNILRDLWSLMLKKEWYLIRSYSYDKKNMVWHFPVNHLVVQIKVKLMAQTEILCVSTNYHRDWL